MYDLTPGQSLKEKQYLEKIKEKNRNRKRLPRGIYNEADLKPSD